MIDVTEVHSFPEFRKAVAQHTGVVFRGQTTDYSEITPSLFRRKPPLDISPFPEAMKSLYFAAHRIDEIAAQVRENEQPAGKCVKADDDEELEIGWFGRLVKRFFWRDEKESNASFDDDEDNDEWNPYQKMIMVGGHGFGSPADYDEYIGLQWRYEISGNHYRDGLLQHYGMPTPVVDVAYEPDIALWFATNKFISDSTTQTAWYERSTGIGVVYVIKASDSELVDLRERSTVPIAGLRGVRQHGGLLTGATDVSPHLTSRVIAKFRIHPGTFDRAATRLKDLTQNHLFPPPAEDIFYRALLDAKHSTDASIHNVASYIVDYQVK
jgi:hypothetical protein